MPDSNSGDLDNLFRLAAEKYPLRTDSSDWEKVARALDKEDNSAAAFPQYTLKEKLIRRRYLLLLLLLPIAGIAYHNWKFSDTAKPGSSAKISIPAAQNTRLLENAKNKNPGLAAKNYNRLDQQSAGTQNATGKIMASTAPVSGWSSLKKKKSAETGNLKNPGINLALQSGYLALAIPPNRHISEKSKEIKQTPAGRREQQQGDDNLDKEIKEEITWPVQKRITNFQIIPNTEAKTADPGIGVNYITNALPDPVQKSQVNAAMKTNQPGPKTHLPLYAGLIIAPDMSEIKSQQVTGVGYTLGVLFGYPISSRFAVESGLYFDEKKYYTEGEYFSTKNVQFLNYVNLLNVNGSCKMLEVPLRGKAKEKEEMKRHQRMMQKNKKKEKMCKNYTKLEEAKK